VSQRPQEKLIDLVASLSSEQQAAVEAFIRYLHQKGSQDSRMDVRAALDEFVREHSELLRRLSHWPGICLSKTFWQSTRKCLRVLAGSKAWGIWTPWVRRSAGRSGYYSDAIEEAAALFESLAQNHPFLDGNKRTAITATAVFLRLNSYKLVFDDVEAYESLISLYETGRVTKAAVAEWLRSHSRPEIWNPRHCSLPWIQNWKKGPVV